MVSGIGATPRSQEEERLAKFAEELRKWRSFDDQQQHKHSYHDREDFIEKRLLDLLREYSGA